MLTLSVFALDGMSLLEGLWGSSEYSSMEGALLGNVCV